jgi:membrane protease subunit HflK
MPFDKIKGGWDQRPPSVDEILEKAGKFFKGGSLLVLSLVILALVAFVLFEFSYYTVGPNEVGMIQRFGKYVGQTTPGPHLKWPIMERVTKVKVDYIYSEEFGLRTTKAGVRTEYASGRAFRDESLMLTGDLNSAVVPWIVQYRVSEPYNFLFKVRNVRETLRDMSEAVMRQVVGDRSVNEVINKREEIADIAEVQLQKALDDAQTGIMVRNVELKKTMPPEPVQPSWNEVNQAVQEKEQMIWKAKEDYNKAIPAARGQADKVISEAEGYALDRINRSKGEVNRFLALLEEYQKAEDVTRRRLYLETMQEVLPKIKKKYIVDHDQKTLLPLLNLETTKVEP